MRTQKELRSWSRRPMAHFECLTRRRRQSRYACPIKAGGLGSSDPDPQLTNKLLALFRVYRRRSTSGDPGAKSTPTLYKPFMLELAIGAVDRIGIDRYLAHNLTNRGESVPWPQQAERDGLSNLLGQLAVRRSI